MAGGGRDQLGLLLLFFIHENDPKRASLNTEYRKITPFFLFVEQMDAATIRRCDSNTPQPFSDVEV